MLNKFKSMSTPYILRYSAQQKIKKMFLGHTDDVGIPLTNNNHFTVFVWNIFKQKRASWLALLEKEVQNSQLVLLQEAYSSPELIDYAINHYLVADQVPVLPIAEAHSGVMTLSTVNPIYCCPLQKKEPLIRLHKSALITVYPLKNGQQLMVANIHAINFSLGVVKYQQQLDDIFHYFQLHQGPIILGGDFNSWSKKRTTALHDLTSSIGLNPVNFTHDIRKKIMGKPLDFIFSRDLYVDNAVMLSTNTSDHNPMRVTFSLFN